MIIFSIQDLNHENVNSDGTLVDWVEDGCMKDLKKDDQLDEHNEMEVILLTDDQKETSKERLIKVNDDIEDYSGIKHPSNENMKSTSTIRVSFHFNTKLYVVFNISEFGIHLFLIILLIDHIYAFFCSTRLWPCHSMVLTTFYPWLHLLLLQ